MPFTKEQTLAIKTRGKNIIVSAGAGSGKTAVLSERILDYCLNGGDIRRVLVLTFTKAAASEMKERIRDKLIENKLDSQANLIDSAYITTFDAYSLSIVKKYYYLLNCSKNVGVIDGSIEETKIKEIIDELFLELYNEKNDRFFKLLTNYTSKDDTTLKKYIINIYKKIDLEIDFNEFYLNYENKYLCNDFYNMVLNDYYIFFNEEYNKLLNYIKLSYDASLNDNNKKFSDGMLSCIEQLSQKDSYDAKALALECLSLPQKRNVKDHNASYYKDLASKQEKILDKYISEYQSEDDIINNVKAIKDDILYVIELCKIIKERLDKYKYSLMSFSFMDIAKMAIKLVKENIDIKEEIKASYDEILIDEYQDTSDIQETFINYIANNNLYMVGDIKQSIYRFRNANPYIFKEKYDNYSKGNGGIKIDLNANFRSRKEVLANINQIFNVIMSENLGDADYIKSHQMNYGLTLYDSLSQDYDFNYDSIIYNYKALCKNEKCEIFNKDEIEAFIIASHIKKSIDLKINIYDKKDKKFRQCDYKDFCILIDKAKYFNTFKKIFDYLNIPLIIDGDLDLKDSIMVSLVKNILTIIYKIKNGEFDISYRHSLTAVLRSFLFSYSDNEIYEIIKLGKSNNEFKIFKELASMKDFSLKELYFNICNKLKIYDKISLIGDVTNSIVVLNEIYKKFTEFDDYNLNFNDLYEYFNNVTSLDSKLSYNPIQSSSNSVKIMTIHKSKGLEFPFCYFTMLSGLFNKEDSRQSFGFDKRYGIYMPYVDEAKGNTVIKLLVANKLKKEDLSEKVRLFYVALTRAREKLVIINEMKDDEKEDNAYTLDSFTSFNEMLIASNVLDFSDKNLVENLKLTKNYKINKTNNSFNKAIIINYQDSNDRFVLKENLKASKNIISLPDKALKKNLETGILLHSILENIDFKNNNLDRLPVDNYYKKIIRNVLNNEIFKNISNAKVFKELEFYFDDNNITYHGIIDMLALYNDHIDIIDYKLYDTSSKEYIRQLSIYQKYVRTIYDLDVNIYLLSLLKNEIKKIIVE